MRIIKYFQPDDAAKDISTVDFANYFSRGFRLVLLDLDNTLSPHGSIQPDPIACQAVENIRAAGLLPALVTNARKERSIAFATLLEIPVVAFAGKPFVRKINQFIQKSGYTPNQTLLIGDQIFTDILAAKRAGLHAVLVQPLNKEEAINIRMKRWFEKPFLRGIKFSD
jgi:HAD superfamily phosphatase (TIGR01668 family)